jgi:hypothetical protein
MKLTEAIILLYQGQGSKSHGLSPFHITFKVFPSSHQATLLISMLVMITFTSTHALGQKMGAGRQYNGRERIGSLKCCHPHHLWDISLWPQYSCCITSISLWGKIITNAIYSYSGWIIAVFNILIHFGNIHKEERTTVLNQRLKCTPSMNMICKSL